MGKSTMVDVKLTELFSVVRAAEVSLCSFVKQTDCYLLFLLFLYLFKQYQFCREIRVRCGDQ